LEVLRCDALGQHGEQLVADLIELLQADALQHLLDGRDEEHLLVAVAPRPVAHEALRWEKHTISLVSTENCQKSHKTTGHTRTTGRLALASFSMYCNVQYSSSL
jgi:hypothetical protein